MQGDIPAARGITTPKKEADSISFFDFHVIPKSRVVAVYRSDEKWVGDYHGEDSYEENLKLVSSGKLYGSIIIVNISTRDPE